MRPVDQLLRELRVYAAILTAAVDAERPPADNVLREIASLLARACAALEQSARVRAELATTLHYDEGE